MIYVIYNNNDKDTIIICEPAHEQRNYFIQNFKINTISFLFLF